MEIANRKKQFCKYLKPGVLAQMRDSQINAKRYQEKSVSQIYLCCISPVASTPDQSGIEIVKNFHDGAPLCHNRKKIVAIKPTNWFPNPNLEIPTSYLTRDQPIIDALNSDVAAHGV